MGTRTVKITTDIGLTVRYDGVYNVYVTLKARYKGKTLGLCGNYNGNPNDDFVKPDKIATANVNEFSDSWKVDSSCPNRPPSLNPCLNAGSLALQAKKKCSLLKLSPFSQCHNTVKQDSGFIQDCEYDVCACKKHTLSCLCEEYAAYVTTCSIAGVVVKWKHLPTFKECCKSLFGFCCYKTYLLKNLFSYQQIFMFLSLTLCIRSLQQRWNM